MPRPDQRLYPRTRQSIYLCGEKKIQALSGIERSDDDLVDIPSIHRPKIPRAKARVRFSTAVHFAFRAIAKKLSSKARGSVARISDSPISAA
jgi:hypothetical protein